MNEPQPRSADPSIVELLNQLSTQTSRLLRDEMRLARAEVNESVRHAGIGAGLLSGAGILALLGLGALTAAGIAALSLVVPVWTAALIAAAVLFAVAGIAALVSKRQLAQASPTPDQTVSNVKDDIQEVKEASHVH